MTAPWQTVHEILPVRCGRPYSSRVVVNDGEDVCCTCQGPYESNLTSNPDSVTTKEPEHHDKRIRFRSGITEWRDKSKITNVHIC